MDNPTPRKSKAQTNDGTLLDQIDPDTFFESGRMEVLTTAETEEEKKQARTALAGEPSVPAAPAAPSVPLTPPLPVSGELGEEKKEKSESDMVTATAPPLFKSTSAPDQMSQNDSLSAPLLGIRSSSAPTSTDTTTTDTTTTTTTTITATTTPILRSQSAPVDDANPQRDGHGHPSRVPSLRTPSRTGRLVAALRQMTGGSADRHSRSSFSGHVETALCPICYCQEPLEDMYTVSDHCKHRFCKECLSGWINVLVTEGKVNQLACPFDAAMVSEEDKEMAARWECGTCTMQNHQTNTICCACSVGKEQWQCSACSFFNLRPHRLSAAAAAAAAASSHISPFDQFNHLSVSSVNDLEMGSTDVGVKIHEDDRLSAAAAASAGNIDMSCEMCQTPARVTPPPQHPAMIGKCGVMMKLEDVQALCTEEVVQKFERFAAMKADPNNRDCPNPDGCDHRQIGEAEEPEMKCEKCNYIFCYEHSAAHPNQNCAWYNKKMRHEVQLTKQAVKAMGTRPCPHCKVDTIKNSGALIFVNYFYF